MTYLYCFRTPIFISWENILRKEVMNILFFRNKKTGFPYKCSVQLLWHDSQTAYMGGGQGLQVDKHHFNVDICWYQATGGIRLLEMLLLLYFLLLHVMNSTPSVNYMWNFHSWIHGLRWFHLMLVLNKHSNRWDEGAILGLQAFHENWPHIHIMLAVWRLCEFHDCIRLRCKAKTLVLM